MKANIMITLLAALSALIGVFAIPLSLHISRAREFVSQPDQRVLPPNRGICSRRASASA